MGTDFAFVSIVIYEAFLTFSFFLESMQNIIIIIYFFLLSFFF